MLEPEIASAPCRSESRRRETSSESAGVAGLVLDSAARLTAEGRIMGTVHYLSREQLHGKQPDSRRDIFAFGVVAYECSQASGP